VQQSFLLVYKAAIPAIPFLPAIMPWSYIMFQSTEISTNASKTETDSSTAGNTAAVPAQNSTKDAGRVHIGGGMMRFHSTKDAGRVHVGGGMMRF
jgi:hypothetical protein